MMRLPSRLLNHGLAALVGVIAGVYYERTNGFSNLVFHATALEQPHKPYLNPIKTVDDNLNRTSSIMKFGFPTFENVKNYSNFVVCYDKRTRYIYSIVVSIVIQKLILSLCFVCVLQRNANWVIEHLNENTLTNKTGKLVSRNGMEFFPDQSIHPYFRTDNEDFKNSGTLWFDKTTLV